MNDSLIQMFGGYWMPLEISANIIVFLNIFGALLLGLIVGYERSYRGRAAGMRTYAMVCMASCALVVISGYPELWYGGQSKYSSVDPGRTIQGIVTGIGFLGAGVIMRDGLSISGLTTAASIWATAAIGVLVGVGFYAAAIVLAVLSAAFMMWSGRIESFLPSRHAISVSIKFKDKNGLQEEPVRQLMRELGYEIARGSFSVSEQHSMPEWKFICISVGKNKENSLVNIGRVFSSLNEVETYQLAHARN